MKPWALVLLAIVPGGSVLALAIWLRRRWLAKGDARALAQIVPPVQRFEKLPAREVDAIRAEAARRHAAASYHRAQSVKTAAGEHVEERIKIVGRR